MTNKLDALVEDELLLMLAEGYEHAPISATTLHKRLINKGIVKGSLSTLSTLNRKHLIAIYREQQLERSDSSPEFKSFAQKGRTNAALNSRIQDLKHQKSILEQQLAEHTEVLLKIVNEVKNKTPVRVDHLLAPYLIRELTAQKKNN